MKKILILLTISLILPSVVSAKTVNGYYKNNGVYVQPYYRSVKDNNFYNNYSTYGNYNPYTGKAGSVKSPTPLYLNPSAIPYKKTTPPPTDSFFNLNNFQSLSYPTTYKTPEKDVVDIKSKIEIAEKELKEIESQIPSDCLGSSMSITCIQGKNATLIRSAGIKKEYITSLKNIIK